MLLAKGPVLHTPSCLVNPGHKLPFRGRVAQPFDHSEATNKVGAPLFAFCAKGGRDAACSADFDVAQIRYFQQRHTRPCQQRKDGAPTLIDRCRQLKGWATRRRRQL